MTSPRPCAAAPSDAARRLLLFELGWAEAYLRSRGANLEARSERGMTPLMTAAGWNESPDVVRVLVDAGADVNARPCEAETVGRMRGHRQRLTSRARETRTPLKEPR